MPLDIKTLRADCNGFGGKFISFDCGVSYEPDNESDEAITLWEDIDEHVADALARMLTALPEALDEISSLQQQVAELTDENKRYREFIEASKDCRIAVDIVNLADDNDRYRAAFKQMIERLHADPKATVHSVFCSWCDEKWPQLDGETAEAAKEYARRHATVCRTHPLRVERDAALSRSQSDAAIVEAARRLVSRSIHRRQDHRELMLRNVELLANDIVALTKLAEAVEAAGETP